MDTQTPIRDLMTTVVIAVQPTDTMDEVQDLFRKNSFHHLPVVDNGKVVGILSKTDYLKLLHGFTMFRTEKSEAYNNAVLRSLLVREVMTKQVATLKADDPIEVAAAFFRENLFHAIPIVDEEHELIGILTTFDLLNYAFRQPNMV